MRYPIDRRYPAADGRYPVDGRLPVDSRYPLDSRYPVDSKYPETRYPSPITGSGTRYPVSENRFPVGTDRNPSFIYKYGNRDRLPGTPPGN